MALENSHAQYADLDQGDEFQCMEIRGRRGARQLSTDGGLSRPIELETAHAFHHFRLRENGNPSVCCASYAYA
jgi:hypothetical protein